eukprot:CAMPEP_0119003846 /NCGR_PEP_ID=MMETSP1176-20130426/796_1 /TAXON_ID=265551 /ORGANISM="Synedropsis recta cf, Strain CCMP1620" /LENGTH=1092 /DNA_ID=CAMNT_0006955483 /DNA_START=39 /DNA_END=3317 /DNA_ORIENTATION=+
MLEKKSINYLAILAISLLGIFVPTEFAVDFGGRKLQLESAAAGARQVQAEQYVTHAAFEEEMSFDFQAGYEGRKLQFDPADAPQSGMTRAQSGLSDSEWTIFATLSYTMGCNAEDACNQCRGHCGSDTDCYGILKCLKRESKTAPVPGCIVPATGYGGNVCYNPESEYYPPSPPIPNSLVSDFSAASCTAAEPCDKCEGLCDFGSDDQCAGDLRCSSFVKNTWPTGRKNCALNGWASSKRGYCMLPEDFVDPADSALTASADWDATVPDRGELVILPECPPEGCPVCTAPMNGWWGCTDDSFCAEGLSCYNEHEKTDTGIEQVTGCSSNKVWIFGYCYSKDKMYEPPDIPHLMVSPSNDDFVLTSIVDGPEECAKYATDIGSVVDVPFSGSSDVSLKDGLFHKVTYIYVVDASQSTLTFIPVADCGDGNSDRGVKHVIDCEILAIQRANEAANAGGNVDLVGLIQFNNVAELLQPLTQPWARLSSDRRDPAIIDQLRTIAPREATNYQAGVEEACEMARDPLNDNYQTVVIFVSDGAPNLGTTTKDTIMNNCGNAIFQTYAVTEAADCDMIDTFNLRPGVDSPDTLSEIAAFSGGKCTKVPDVSKLPDLLVQLEKTTWDGVTVKVNGVAAQNATINYSTEPSIEAPASVTYSGSVPLGPGVHTVCLETTSSTSGILDVAETCKTVVVEAIEAVPTSQLVNEGEDARFTVSFGGREPGCDTFGDKIITVETCDGSTQITETLTGDDGSVIVTVLAVPGVKEACYKVCHAAGFGSKSCTITTVEYLEAVARQITDSGVNGDPLIMGLSGQLFKFDGRNGAWYSAVSTPSFQWNMKINSYETCPAHSDTFVSGAGFRFLKNGKTTKSIEVNVVNPYDVNVGCGSDDIKNCLGAGSLELIIDGEKHVVGGDYKTKDGLARITAFNTYYPCSRKWYDFNVQATKDLANLRSGRQLNADEPDVFEVIKDLKKTMINQDECQKWINDRQEYRDLFLQPGHYSTVIIKTNDIALHLEYKQENERCDAHTIDVWISSLSPDLLEENWEGVIGETKDVDYVSTGKDPIMKDRSEILKFPKDTDYEVNSPFSTQCKGCNKQKK